MAEGMALTLHPLLLVLLAAMCGGEPNTDESCPLRQSWSSDLGKCMECSICEKAGKSDFCQTCESVAEEQFVIPWLIIGLSAVGFVLITVILTVTVYLRRCRRKSKFTTPIEETGAHSAEELLIH